MFTRTGSILDASVELVEMTRLGFYSSQIGFLKLGAIDR
ncbi:hypothetical protein C4K04_1573 [Pseudomonas chlororaphis]|uniref:Uncharacterized protein n=1 Tax=Pseudomonas chlororaphis TaxID=587753 RepID=A0A3G7TJL4_9PSED|nr:hypothetical protein C4K04_1573 [Pseudomonas chlororaphis]